MLTEWLTRLARKPEAPSCGPSADGTRPRKWLSGVRCSPWDFGSGFTAATCPARRISFCQNGERRFSSTVAFGIGTEVADSRPSRILVGAIGKKSSSEIESGIERWLDV
jgi:hypothetical protein